MLRTALRQEICPGINAPGMSNPQSCGETAAPHFLFIPNLTIAPPFSSRWSCFTGSQRFSFLLSADPTMDKTQRTTLMVLPFLVITIAWRLPAGLLVCWIP